MFLCAYVVLKAALTNIIHLYDALYPSTSLYYEYLHSKKGTMRKFFTIAFVSALIPFIGFAHEGHGSTNGYTITHYFVEPEHAIYTWSFLMVSAVLVSYFRIKKRRSTK
jgi:hypothetical protein